MLFFIANLLFDESYIIIFNQENLKCHHWFMDVLKNREETFKTISCCNLMHQWNPFGFKIKVKSGVVSMLQLDAPVESIWFQNQG